MKDISEYYVGDLAIAEEKAWDEVKEYKRNYAQLELALSEFNAKSVVELGCGSGWIARELPAGVRYVGFDKNPTFLGWAKGKNRPDRTFVYRDVREISPAWLKENHGEFDLACCFAFLKHFGLHECDDVLMLLLSLAPRAVFDIQITDRDIDNGTDFHHVFVTKQRLEQVVAAGGHRIVNRNVAWEGPFPQGRMQVQIVTTEKAR